MTNKKALQNTSTYLLHVNLNSGYILFICPFMKVHNDIVFSKTTSQTKEYLKIYKRRKSYQVYLKKVTPGKTLDNRQDRQ